MTRQKVETKKVEKKKKMAITMFARDGKEEGDLVGDYCITGDIPREKAFWMLIVLVGRLGDLAEDMMRNFTAMDEETINDLEP